MGDDTSLLGRATLLAIVSVIGVFFALRERHAHRAGSR